MVSNQDSNVAPQTLQDAWPVCGTKNFVSVRLYSAPQSHWAIVSILGICAFGEPVQAGLFAGSLATGYIGGGIPSLPTVTGAGGALRGFVIACAGSDGSRLVEIGLRVKK